MWCIIDAAGIVCVVITYLTVMMGTIGFLRIGIWEELLVGDPWAIFQLVVFHYHVVMIYWSHVKCMTTEPGVLDKGYEELDLGCMSP
jgi:hypothetical protein